MAPTGYLGITELKKRIERKAVLIDTNVIIETFRNAEELEPFYSMLKDADCVPASFSFIEFEFLRGAFEPQHRALRHELLEKLYVRLPNNPSTSLVSDATRIANAYSARKLDSPKIVDCCIAAYLMKTPSNLFLATLNHQDFPPFLFDILYLYPTETPKKVLPIGIYAFNPEKAAALGL